jgi:hypothetical protein
VIGIECTCCSGVVPTGHSLARAKKVMLGKVMLGKVMLGKVMLGKVMLGKVMIGKVMLGKVMIGKVIGPIATSLAPMPISDYFSCARTARGVWPVVPVMTKASVRRRW